MDNADLNSLAQDAAKETAKQHDLGLLEEHLKGTKKIMEAFIEKHGHKPNVQEDFPLGLMDEAHDLLINVQDFLKFVDDYTNWDLG
tara:strand:- start:1342 stop:1599 length:258 start_codon:yes stop_codon:yes gene_type:complete